MHADHITGTGLLKKLLPTVKTGISAASGAKADFTFKDGDVLDVGKHKVEVRATPGHTNGEKLFHSHATCAFPIATYRISLFYSLPCLELVKIMSLFSPGCCTFVVPQQSIAFTGDSLLIRGCGRTDFQEGNPATLYESVSKNILALPDNYTLFPAHDYKG